MDKQINGFLYVMVEKLMYGLVQAGIIAHTVLKEHLRPFGYELDPISLILFLHSNNRIKFTLVVYYVVIRYKIR